MSETLNLPADAGVAGHSGDPRERPDWVAHAVLGLGVLLFALPVWLAMAGSTQDSGAILRGDLSLLPGSEGFRAYRRVLCAGGRALSRSGTCC